MQVRIKSQYKRKLIKYAGECMFGTAHTDEIAEKVCEEDKDCDLAGNTFRSNHPFGGVWDERYIIPARGGYVTHNFRITPNVPEKVKESYMNYDVRSN